MKTRPTLNGLEPRTSRDSERNPYDWLEEPEKAAQMHPDDRLLLAAVGIVLILALAGVI